MDTTLTYFQICFSLSIVEIIGNLIACKIRDRDNKRKQNELVSKRDVVHGAAKKIILSTNWGTIRSGQESTVMKKIKVRIS